MIKDVIAFLKGNRQLVRWFMLLWTALTVLAGIIILSTGLFLIHNGQLWLWIGITAFVLFLRESLLEFLLLKKTLGQKDFWHGYPAYLGIMAAAFVLALPILVITALIINPITAPTVEGFWPTISLIVFYIFILVSGWFAFNAAALVMRLAGFAALSHGRGPAEIISTMLGAALSQMVIEYALLSAAAWLIALVLLNIPLLGAVLAAAILALVWLLRPVMLRRLMTGVG